MDTDTIEELDRLREQNAAMLEALKAARSQIFVHGCGDAAEAGLLDELDGVIRTAEGTDT